MSQQDIAVVAHLHERAWRQGYNLGFHGRPAYAGDWEADFRKSYMGGFDTGKADRAKAQTEKLP